MGEGFAIAFAWRNGLELGVLVLTKGGVRTGIGHGTSELAAHIR